MTFYVESHDDDKSKLRFPLTMLQKFILVMLNIVISEELEVEDEVFDSCCYRRPHLIARIQKVTTSSRETPQRLVCMLILSQFCVRT